MKIKNIGKITNTVNTIENIEKLKASAKDIEKSRLDDQTKSKALEEYGKMVKSLLIITISLSVILIGEALLSLLFYSMNIISDDLVVFVAVGLALITIIIAIIAMFIYFKKITPTYRKALDYISRGWDRLSESELEKFLLNDEEKKMIKKYNRLIIIWALIGVTLMLFYI